MVTDTNLRCCFVLRGILDNDAIPLIATKLPSEMKSTILSPLLSIQLSNYFVFTLVVDSENLGFPDVAGRRRAHSRMSPPCSPLLHR